MNKLLFHAAFVAFLSSAGCANPMTRLFAKKPTQEDFLAYRQAKEGQVATRMNGAKPKAAAPAAIADALNAGNAAMQRGAMSEAQSHYLSVVQRQPNHPTANHRLAVIADQRGDFVAAERHYQTALAAAPRDASLLNDVGYSYLMQSRYADAERYLSQSLQLNPNQQNAANNLASLYLQQGRTDQAMSALRRVCTESEAQAKLAQLSRSLPASVANVATPQSDWSANPLNGLSGNRAGANAETANQFATDAGAAGFNIDPNLPESTRRLLESMETERRRAISDRNARDAAERARRDFAARQARQESLGQSGIIPAGNESRGTSGRGGYPPAASPGQSGPIVIGPPPNSDANQPVPPQFGAAPAAPQFNGYGTGAIAFGQSGSPNTFDRVGLPAYGDPLASGQPAFGQPSNPGQPIGTTFGTLPNRNPSQPSSPLDNMAAWPPNANAGSAMPTHRPQEPSNMLPQPPGGGYGGAANPADEAEAARYGMSAGSLFPMAPANPRNAAVPNLPNFNMPQSPTNPGANLPSNHFGPNSIPQGQPPLHSPSHNAPAFGMPPIGPSSFTPQAIPNGAPFSAGQNSPNGLSSSSVDPRMQNAPSWSESPAQFSPAQIALQEQFPPSGQYQTPSAFGSPNPNLAPPAANGNSFGAASPIPGSFGFAAFPQAELAQPASHGQPAWGNVRTNPNLNDQWLSGAAPQSGSPNASTPAMQNWIATPFGDQSLGDYEKLVQMHNAETNSIRQQIDSQRQLPGSEQFLRSQGGGSTGGNSNALPIIKPSSANGGTSAFPTRSPSTQPSGSGAVDQWPHGR